MTSHIKIILDHVLDLSQFMFTVYVTYRTGIQPFKYVISKILDVQINLTFEKKWYVFFLHIDTFK
jgi:hypothetical protein